MPAVAAFLVAWSLIWAVWQLAVMAALPPRWLDQRHGPVRDGVLFAVNALACAAGYLAARAVS
jgi:hypothetical protein